MSIPPANFSWVSDTVAGFAFPYSKENLEYLVNQAHISNLITLTDEKPRHLADFPTLKHYFYPVEEFMPGDLEMVCEIISIIADAEANGEKSGVHCQFGQMRTVVGMCSNWPCSLHSLISPHWFPNDVVAEMWANDSEFLSVQREASLIWSDFFHLATQLAEYIHPLSPTLVGILWSPSVYTIVAVHGVLLSSSAFIPLSDRNCSPEILELFGAVICFSIELDVLNEDFECVQTSPFKIFIRSAGVLQRLPIGDLAYCTTTSGSTGSPKLVLTSHSCASANVVDLCARLPPATNTSGVFITAPLTFDACIIQFYLGLATHRRAVLLSASLLFSMEGKFLAQVISSANVDIWQCTPSVFGRLPLSPAGFKHMWIFLGGEPCSTARLSKWTKYWNFFFLYGLTEVSAWSSIIDANALMSEEPPRAGATPLGVAMAHSLVVLKDINKETGIGQVYTARKGGGYATVEKPFTVVRLLAALQKMPDAGLVATGDFAIAAPISQSPLWFLGRKDRVFKVHGRKCHMESLETEILELLTNRLNGSCLHVINCRCNVHPLRAHVQLCGALSPKEADDIKGWLLQRITFPISSCNLVLSNSLLNLNANGKVVDKSVRLACLSSIGPMDENTKEHYQLTFQQLGGSSLKAMHLIESLTSDWPSLKEKKAQLLSTLFSRPFAEFIQLAQESVSTEIEDAGEELVSDTDMRKKPRSDCKAELIWSAVLGKCVDASPIVDVTMESIFVGSHAGIFRRLCLRTGEIVWSHTVGSRVEATACLIDDLVVFGTLDGHLHALRTADGILAWTLEMGGAVKSSPTRVSGPSRLLVGSHGRRVLAIDGKGHIVWVANLDRSPIVAPITVDGKSEFAFVGTLGGGLHRITVNLGITDWSVDKLGPIFGAPTLLSGLGRVVVTTADGGVHCLSESRGERLWTTTVVPQGGFFSPSVPLPHYPPLLLLANQSGHLHALASADGGVVWSTDCSAVERTVRAHTAFLTTPSVTLQEQQRPPLVVFARTDGRLFVCVGHARTPPTLHVVYRLPAETFSVPLLLHLKPSVVSILIGCRDDTVNRLDISLKDIFEKIY
ncbi:Beta-alanine-activating enzyme [Taenia crassiceps]|uniref:Beta-alanine-activating enzyme n=1 Tax=Taenia crassiceps TaxID=6207 RepID=A0ABR4QCB0_9CEST